MLSLVRDHPCICYEHASEKFCFFTVRSYSLQELNLSSCLLTHEMLQMLQPAFRHTRSLKWDKFIIQRFGFAVEMPLKFLTLTTFLNV